MLIPWFAPVSASFVTWLDQAAEWAADNGFPTIALIVALDGVIPIFPGETAIVTGGNFAGQGELSLLVVILAGFVGAVVGDSCAYWLGRAGGDRIHRFMRRFAGAERAAAADRMIQQRGPVLVAAGRFLPGIRLAINLSCGAGHMSYKRFLIFDAIGAAVWSTQAALLGFAFGKTFEEKKWLGLLIAIGIALIIGAAVAAYEHRRVRHHSRLAAAEAAAAAEDG